MKSLMSLSLIFLFLVGCSFRSAHERFVDDMNTTIEYKDYEKYKEKFFEISDKYLIKQDYDKQGNTLYHFERPTRYCQGGYCNYYIVVNPKGIIIDWGFDPCDKEKCCQIRG